MERETYKAVDNPLGISYFSFAYCRASEIGAYFLEWFLAFLYISFSDRKHQKQKVTLLSLLWLKWHYHFPFYCLALT